VTLLRSCLKALVCSCFIIVSLHFCLIFAFEFCFLGFRVLRLTLNFCEIVLTDWLNICFLKMFLGVVFTGFNFESFLSYPFYPCLNMLCNCSLRW
jgi:uncharacterized membrane protein